MQIKEVLNRLTDQTWHNLDELSSVTHLDKEKTAKILAFFKEYGFVELSGEKVKIDKDYLSIPA